MNSRRGAFLSAGESAACGVTGDRAARRDDQASPRAPCRGPGPSCSPEQLQAPVPPRVKTRGVIAGKAPIDRASRKRGVHVFYGDWILDDDTGATVPTVDDSPRPPIYDHRGDITDTRRPIGFRP